MSGPILVIAESDCSGASGIQADIKTAMALGSYAMTAVTLISAQNVCEVAATMPVPPAIVAAQMHSVLDTMQVNAVKVGYLDNENLINAIADVLDARKDKTIPIVVDPSIISRTGQLLVEPAVLAACKRRLYMNTTVLTPNLKEAEFLSGIKIEDIDDIRHVVDMMRTLGVENVVLKGGQVESGKELYFVATAEGERIYERPTINTPYTLGAGSTFSSALAVSLGQKMPILRAVEHSLDFLHQTILRGLEMDHNRGVVNQGFQNDERDFDLSVVKIHKLSNL